MDIISFRPLINILTAAIFVFLLPVNDAYSQTGYISDQLIVKVRASQEPDSSVITRVRTDEPVSILSTQGKQLFVETQAGFQGWIDSQYVMIELPKTVIIEQLRNELAVLRERQAASSTGQVDTFTGDEEETVRNLTIERDILRTELSLLKSTIEELENSFNVPEQHSIEIGNDSSTNETYPLTDKISEALDERPPHSPNTESADDSQSFDAYSDISYKQMFKNYLYWFLAGTGIYLAGIISGRISGKGRRKRLSYY